tara:strand:- start:241 stop:1632 length:1392 start_codon:yes stop_codon:yes gene_type:complete
MASAKLSRTPGSETNRKTWTWSAWIKRSSIGNSTASNGYTLWNCEGNNANDNFIFQITVNGGGSGGPTDSLALHTYGNDVFRTTPLLRDMTAWYHIVFALDTTQSTATDRIKLYINGSQISYSQEANFPSQNYNMGINRNSVHCIGSHGSNANYYFDGQMAHVHFTDGTAYPASTFGEADATTGIWKPKTSPSVTYGTNGYFLKMDNSANMGLDSSGNSNNFTTSGTIIQTKDTPSNVFATLNALNSVGTGANPSYSLINTKTVSSNDNYFGGSSTLGMTKGKYYIEVELDAQSSSGQGVIGMSTNIFEEARQNRHFGQLTSNPSAGYYGSNGNKVVDGGTDASYGNSYTAGDIIGIAIDCDNNYIYFAKNGTWQNSGVPTSGSTGTGGIALTSTDREWFLSLGDGGGSATATYLCNFGNGYFGTTAVSSAQNPDDGIGVFEYDVPAGYRALCTKSLNAQEYS